MADEEKTPYFQVGDRLVDGWGREAPEGAEDEELGYESWTGKQLMAEIQKRNEGREEEAQITPAGKKKSDAVAALVADDEANSTADEE